MTSKLEELGKENLEYLEDLTDSNSKLDRIAVIRQNLKLPLFAPISTMQEFTECKFCEEGERFEKRSDLTKAQDIALCAKNIEKAFLRVEHQVTEMTGFHSVLTLLSTISHELGHILDSEPEKFD